MKNTRKKMLLSSIAMLLVALVALGSATYAWFTINKVVEANTIKVQANVADGLVINNAQTKAWNRTVSYADAYTELNPVSIDVTATDGTAALGTPYYAKDVKSDGPKVSDSAKGFTAAALPTGNKTGQTLQFNANSYVAAYTMDVASSGDAINKAVTAEITATGTANKDGTTFAKAALVKGGKVIGFYSDEQYTAITGTGDTPTTHQVVADASTSISAMSSVPVKASCDTFTLYVWYEGKNLAENFHITKNTIKTDAEEELLENEIEEGSKELEEVNLNSSVYDEDSDIAQALRFVEENAKYITTEDISNDQYYEIIKLRNYYVHGTEFANKYKLSDNELFLTQNLLKIMSYILIWEETAFESNQHKQELESTMYSIYKLLTK